MCSGFFLRWELAENGTFTLFTQACQRRTHTGTMVKEALTDYHHVLSSTEGRVSTTAFKCSGRTTLDAPVFVQGIGADKHRGTNIQHILTMLSSSRRTWPQLACCTTGQCWKSAEPLETNSIVPATGGLLGLLVLLCTVVTILLLLKQRQQPSAWKSKVPISCSRSSDNVTTWHSSSDSLEV